MMILETYEINEHTIALCPAKQIDYDTVVLTKHGSYKVRQTPFQLINQGCEANWSTYEGRRQIVVQKKNFKRKVPIPISPEREIIAFPTHAPKHFECYWFFVNHIAHIEKCQQNKQLSTLIFKNMQAIQLPLTPYSIKTQYKRALACLNKHE